jgi:hypothetical protein
MRERRFEIGSIKQRRTLLIDSACESVYLFSPSGFRVRMVCLRVTSNVGRGGPLWMRAGLVPPDRFCM